MKTAQLAIFYFICLLGILPVAATAQPYVISADGSEVTDQKTGLIWRRCAEGMSWNGTTCAGMAGAFTHEAALQCAAAQATGTGVAWRLPNIKELASIADRSRSFPAIDPAAFPAAPANWFWSSSPDAGAVLNPASAWGVSFNFGHVGIVYYSRSNSHYVRLVRAGQ